MPLGLASTEGLGVARLRGTGRLIYTLGQLLAATRATHTDCAVFALREDLVARTAGRRGFWDVAACSWERVVLAWEEDQLLGAQFASSNRSRARGLRSRQDLYVRRIDPACSELSRDLRTKFFTVLANSGEDAGCQQASCRGDYSIGFHRSSEYAAPARVGSSGDA